MHNLNIVLGLIASISFISANFILNRRRMLFVFTFAMIVVSLQYGLLGVWAVPVVNAISLVRNFVLIKKPWSGRRVAEIGIGTVVVLVIATFATTGIPNDLRGWFPLIAGVLGAIALSSLNMFWIKSFLMSTSFVWAILDISYRNWQTLIGDAFSVGAAGIALIRLTRSAKTEQ